MRVCTHGQTAPEPRKHQLATLTSTGGCFCMCFYHPQGGVSGKEPAWFDPQGVGFWEREVGGSGKESVGLLGKSQFANPLKTKAYLAFSAPYNTF